MKLACFLNSGLDVANFLQDKGRISKWKNEKSTGNKYTVKDAAIIGIFCAVMFVVFMVYSILTGASLFYSMIFNAAGAALILAPFYVYMCMKVGKHGPALVYNIMWRLSPD